MDHRIGRLVFLVFFISFFSGLSAHSASDVLIIVTPTIEKKAQGSVVKKSQTSFSDIIVPGAESSGLIDTTEALRRASSVDFSDYGGATTAPVTLRGSSYRQTLVTLDGIPLNPITGDMVDLSLYMLPDIDRIEIVKGSNSATFGRAAMSGTINLVTENPSPVNEYNLYASQGSHGYGLYHAHASARSEQAGVLANITRAFADNDFRYKRDDGTWVRRENNSTLNTTGLVKTVFEMQGWQSALMGNFIVQSNGSPGAEPGYITPEDWMDASQNAFLFETGKAFAEDQSLGLHTSVLTNKTKNTRPSWGPGNDSLTRLVTKDISMTYSRKIGPVTLTPMVAYCDEHMNSDDYGIHSRSTGSGSISATADLQRFLLELSTRYDDSSDFDGKWSYHAGAAVKVSDKVQIKANAGTGYLLPDMGKLYAPSSVFSTFVPNPDLEPERSFSWDIGPCITMNNYGFSTNYFETSYRDLIKSDYPTADSFTYINVNKAKSSGVEASAWVAPTSEIKCSTSYILSHNTFESGPYKGNELGQRPAQVLNVQTDYLSEIARKNATIFLSYQFRQGSYKDDANTERTDNRYILNAGAQLEVSSSATVSFKVDNLLDDRSPEYVYKSSWGTSWYPVQGRTYRLAAKVNL